MRQYALFQGGVRSDYASLDLYAVRNIDCAMPTINAWLSDMTNSHVSAVLKDGKLVFTSKDPYMWNAYVNGSAIVITKDNPTFSVIDFND